MSTRAQIAIRIGPEQWAHVYHHFDGYPSHCCPHWTPEDILTDCEIRQVAPEPLDCFNPPRDPRILPRPTRALSHLYIWIGCQWLHVVPQADASGL